MPSEAFISGGRLVVGDPQSDCDEVEDALQASGRWLSTTDPVEVRR